MSGDEPEPELPAKDDESDPSVPPKRRGSRFVPKRPPPSRDEMVRMLRNKEPVTMGEIFDAVRDKRLTEEEAAEFLPEVYGESAQKAMRELGEQQREWSRQMQELADSFRRPFPVTDSAPPIQDPQVVATREVRAELAGVAEILKTTGEQIFSMAQLAASTVTNLELVYRETSALRGALVEFEQQSVSASRRLETLTKWLTGFTIGLAFLTVVIVVLTGIVAWHDLTH